MLRFLLITGAMLILANYSQAQTPAPDLNPAQCEQIRQAVAQYGYAAARRHAYLQRRAVSKRVNSSKADKDDPTLIEGLKPAAD